MDAVLLTPGSVAQHGTRVEVPVPDYDWRRQQRWVDDSPVAGGYTGGSVRTFDVYGKPSDSHSDYND